MRDDLARVSGVGDEPTDFEQVGGQQQDGHSRPEDEEVVPLVLNERLVELGLSEFVLQRQVVAAGVERGQDLIDGRLLHVEVDLHVEVGHCQEDSPRPALVWGEVAQQGHVDAVAGRVELSERVVGEKGQHLGGLGRPPLHPYDREGDLAPVLEDQLDGGDLAPPLLDGHELSNRGQEDVLQALRVHVFGNDSDLGVVLGRLRLHLDALAGRHRVAA